MSPAHVEDVMATRPPVPVMDPRTLDTEVRNGWTTFSAGALRRAFRVWTDKQIEEARARLENSRDHLDLVEAQGTLRGMRKLELMLAKDLPDDLISELTTYLK